MNLTFNGENGNVYLTLYIRFQGNRACTVRLCKVCMVLLVCTCTNVHSVYGSTNVYCMPWLCIVWTVLLMCTCKLCTVWTVLLMCICTVVYSVYDSTNVYMYGCVQCVRFPRSTVPRPVLEQAESRENNHRNETE